MLSEFRIIVKDVGKVLLEWRKNKKFAGKYEGTQFKAEADLMVHEELEKKLKKLTPGVFIISEENVSSHVDERPNHYWMIDPIDGTASFVGGYPGFVIQMALMEENIPKLAIIYAPFLDELYHAESGCGAYLNNRIIHVRDVKKPNILIDNYPEPKGLARAAYNKWNIEEYVECGSISLKMCNVAKGKADLFIKDVVVRDWDLAAPHLLLNEAGGSLTDIYGQDIEYSGAYEHKGVIAMCSKKGCMELSSWYKDFVKKGGIK